MDRSIITANLEGDHPVVPGGARQPAGSASAAFAQSGGGASAPGRRAADSSIDEAASGPAAASYTILCVDDEPHILAALRRVFRPRGYRFLTAGSGDEALQLLEHDPVDMIISDMRMPGMDGASLLEQVRASQPDAVRLLLTGHADIDATIGAINRGEIHRYIAKPWDEGELLLIVRQALERKTLEHDKRRLEALTHRQNAELKAFNATLELKVEQRTAQLREAADGLAAANTRLKTSFLTSIKVFSNLIELRETDSAGHSRRAADLARKIAGHMGLGAGETNDVFIAGLLHDVGKIGLPDAMLRNPASGKDVETSLAYRKYPLRSERALMPLEDLRGAAKIIRSHRERFDGRGFPDGLAGTAIPLGARILALAKDYDAAQIGRLLRDRMTAEAALAHIVQGRMRRYDPDVVDAFLAVSGAADVAARPDARIDASDLVAGMVLSRDLVTHEGVLLLTADRLLDENVVERIRDYQASDSTPLAIYVRADKSA